MSKLRRSGRAETQGRKIKEDLKVGDRSPVQAQSHTEHIIISERLVIFGKTAGPSTVGGSNMTSRKRNYLDRMSLHAYRIVAGAARGTIMALPPAYRHRAGQC